MTEEEALKNVRFCKCEIKNDYFVAWLKHETIPIVCKALEKQIPIELEKQGYFKICRCGCEMSIFLMQNKANYCPNCGQAIKWE